MHAAANLCTQTLLNLQWKDNVFDSFKVTRCNEHLFEIGEVNAIDMGLFRSHEELVPLSPERDGRDATLKLHFPLGKDTKGRQSHSASICPSDLGGHKPA